MVIQFTLQDLLLFLGCTLVIAIGIISLPVLWDIKKITGTLRSLVETNEDSIQKSIRTIPGILENTEHISNNVRDTTDKFKTTVPVILQEAEYVSHAAKESIEITSAAIEQVSSEVIDTVDAFKKNTSDFATYYHIITELLQTLYRAYTSRK